MKPTARQWKLLANENQQLEMIEKYKNKNQDFGYGHAKQELFELIVKNFETEREKYNFYINNISEMDRILELGATKARTIADNVLERVRKKLGFGAV